MVLMVRLFPKIPRPAYVPYGSPTTILLPCLAGSSKSSRYIDVEGVVKYVTTYWSMYNFLVVGAAQVKILTK
jgi:hypothetical protein